MAEAAKPGMNPWKARELRMARRYWGTDEYDCIYDSPEARRPKRCKGCGRLTAWYKATVGAFVCTRCGHANH